MKKPKQARSPRSKKKASLPILPVSTVKRLLLAILFFAFATRIFRLHLPQEYIFDEVYHAVTAKLIAANDVRAFEWWNPAPEPNTAVDWLHPPLAKYTQAFFIAVLGASTLSWRLSSVFFGVGVIWLTYEIGGTVFKNNRIGLVAATLASLDGLLLTQSRIAMNDIHVTFFILATFLVYFRLRNGYINLDESKKIPAITPTWQLTAVGVLAGLAMATKWSGLFILGFTWLGEGLFLLSVWYQFLVKTSPSKKSWYWLTTQTKIAITSKALLIRLWTLLVIPLFIYVAAYTPMFLQGKSLICQHNYQIQGECYFERMELFGETYEGYISHFAMLHRQIWWYQTTLEATHGYQSRPWQWFFNLRPVWFYVSYVDQGHVANIYNLGNSMLFWFGGLAVIISLASPLLKSDSRMSYAPLRYSSQTVRFGFAALITAYALVWLPWTISPRIMFFYHYTPAVPFLSIVLSYWLVWLYYSGHRFARATSLVVATSIVLFFVAWYPNWTGITVPKAFANTVYFSVKSWK